MIEKAGGAPLIRISLSFSLEMNDMISLCSIQKNYFFFSSYKRLFV
ncbi:hypothetical protein SD78_3158 [Bacillus badius]|nr:hypothetical protein SD78_3158 [Bacillus badius]